MSYENMTEAELDAVCQKLGLAAKPAPLKGAKGAPRKGRAELAKLLKSDPDRLTRQLKNSGSLSPEITLLLRLMVEEGYTAEMVEAIPPFLSSEKQG
jgi:hypothetical protein